MGPAPGHTRESGGSGGTTSMMTNSGSTAEPSDTSRTAEGAAGPLSLLNPIMLPLKSTSATVRADGGTITYVNIQGMAVITFPLASSALAETERDCPTLTARSVRSKGETSIFIKLEAMSQ